MAPSAKGKEKVIEGGKGTSGKRKRNDGGNDDDKTGRGKRKNRGVLQFFEDAAYEVDEDDASDDSFFDNDFLEDEFDTAATATEFRNEPSRAPFPPFVIKEEEPTEEELEKMLQERYKPGSTFVAYAEDNFESKRTVERPEYHPYLKDPIIWKVKCMVGRERHSAFCLMQKYVDLQFLGKKLQIISAFALDHIKGFIYIEAEKQCDINEACNGLCSIYSSRVAPVPKDDISHLFSVRSKGNGISEGMWARVKNGKYKGDLAQVVAVNYARKKVTVKLIPRIDLQALAEKFGRGNAVNRAANPAPRLISSSELEEFRPLIQCRRDRDTNEVFEVLDGMMLKDGYLYKKVSIDSLSFWGVTPKDDELLKFEPSKNDESIDVEWLSQLYGEPKKKRPLISDKGGGKGEGSSSSSFNNDFEVHDLVFFGRKDFGVIIGTEKDEIFKIIKAGSEGPVVVNIPRRELKNASFDKKLFTALDQQMKNISINDSVKVLDGPLKDREGTVKRIYRGIIFLCNETVEENNGYICVKAQMCEKVELPGEACTEKGGGPGFSTFGDFVSSPKSPLSPKQSDQGRDGSRNFNREDNAMFSVGQSLRIRVGPLKGYLCRVLAIRRSEVTVKLDSQHKILTIKCEHLAEVRTKSSGISLGEDSDSLKPFDLLGVQDGSTDWLKGTAKAAEGGSWNAEGFSTERSSWPAFPASNFSLQTEPKSSNPLKPMDEDANKGDSSWEAKPTANQGSSWGVAAAALETIVDSGQVVGWGNQEDSCKKGAFSTGFGSSATGSWGKAVESINQAAGKGLKEDSWGQTAGNLSIKDDSSGSKSTWNASGVASVKPTVGWGNAPAQGSLDQPDANAWNKAGTSNERQTENWGTTRKDGEGAGWGKDAEASAWNQSVGVTDGGSSWNKQDGGFSGNKQGGGSSWNKPNGGSSSQSKQGGDSSWSKPDGGSSSSWNKATTSNERRTESWGTTRKDEEGAGWAKDAEASALNQSAGVTDGGSSWNKQDGGSSGNKQGGSSSWSKPDGGSTSQSKQGGESSWSKPDGGSSSWSKPDGGSSSWSKPDRGSSSWSKPEGGSTSWSKQGGGSSWSKPEGGSTSWSKQGGGSSWSKPDGGSTSWSKEVGAKENKGDTDQGGSWERSEPFDGGWGSGGRRGRGGGRGGRGQFGRGRSFGQGETSNWAKGNTDDDGFRVGTFKGKISSWNSGQEDSWDKSMSSTGGKEDCWGKPNSSGGSDESEWNKVWVANKETAELGGKSRTRWNGLAKDQDGDKGFAGNESSDWQNKDALDASKSSGGTRSSGWNKGSMSTEQKSESKGQDDAWNKGGVSTADQASGWKKGASDSGRPVDGGGNWEKTETPLENSEFSWKTSTTSLDGNQSSAWGSKSNWDAQKVSLDKTSSWGQKSDDRKMDVEVDRGGSGNGKKTSDGGSSSGWGQSKWGGATDAGGGNLDKLSSWVKKSDDSKIDVEADKNGAWNSKKTSDGGSTSGWGQSKWGGATDVGGGILDKPSSWGKKSDDSKIDAETNKDGAWSSKKTLEGGSTSGWGRSNWGRATDGGGGSSSGWGQSKWGGETDAEGKQNSWSSKGNWNSGNNFSSNEEQNDTFGDRGRGGNWREGRGGRWGQDRGGFGGRGGSEQGDFGGRGGSYHGGFGGRGRSDRGGFGSRNWSNRGGFGGRDRSDGGDFGGRAGSDRGGFRGRGDFGRRGRGRRDDWNKNDSGEDKPYSWSNTSSNDVNWKSNSGGGNWNDGVRDKGQWQSGRSGLGAAGGGDSAQAGGLNKGNNNAGGSDAQASGWNREESNWKAKDAASDDMPNSWKNGSNSNAEGLASKNSGGNWQGAGSDWTKSKEPVDGGDMEQAGGWTRRLGLSKDVGGSDAETSGWSSQDNSWKTSNSSGRARSSGWNQTASAQGEGAGTADAWGKAAASSWAYTKDGNDKGGW